MKVGKPKSKRVSVRLRHRIEKASSAKQRKQRKEAKKNPEWRSRLKKDPGIPNLFPYKAKLLAEIEESKRQKEEEQMRKKDLAKARRQGKAVETMGSTSRAETDEEEDDLIDEDLEEEIDSDEDMEEGGSNPMAALLASAQARARNFGKDDIPGEDLDDESEEDDEADIDAVTGKTVAPTVSKTPSRKVLPQQALADPIKIATTLMGRLQQTSDGVQKLLEHYQIPPIVTGGSDITTRFLVEVARKRGRLGRGGVPNLHSAALIVLSDVNEGTIQLPAVPRVQKASVSNKGGKSEVKIVQQMAEPFRIEGLWEDDHTTQPTSAMAVDV